MRGGNERIMVQGHPCPKRKKLNKTPSPKQAGHDDMLP
jgi:hypothetical protein